MARLTVILAIACAGFATVTVQASAGSMDSEGGSCESPDHCSQLEDSEASALLQSSSVRGATASNLGCSTKSLIIAQEVGEETYLQWNAELTANGADFRQFLNASQSGGEVRFDTDVDFVKHGRPVFGIVYIRLFGVKDLRKQDALKLKDYIDAGGMLVVGEGNPSQVNSLMENLGSSIRQQDADPGDFPCSTPADAPYVPIKHWGSSFCPYTRGVTGLQGSNLDEVIDLEDSSNPLFTLKTDTEFVVARVEKKRSLVVVGDDEPFDDDCAQDDQDNRLAFGPTTNLRFFANLWQQRCRHHR